jgi:glycosyltransferase involved in cell wall biosynthesis
MARVPRRSKKRSGSRVPAVPLDEGRPAPPGGKIVVPPGWISSPRESILPPETIGTPGEPVVAKPPKSFRFADKIRLFVLGLPHTKTLDPSRDGLFSTCAFTTKVFHLCKMMTGLGHEVIHLGNEGSDPPCAEHVSVGMPALWDRLYGSRKPTDFYDITEDGKYATFMDIFASKIRLAILERTAANPDKSIICVTWGGAQMRGVQGLPHYVVESGIGYPNCFTRDYRVYESYAWKHFHEGKEDAANGDRWYHWVIPNAFDPAMFGPVVPTAEKQDYFLCLCRLIDSKGVKLACDVAAHVGIPIKIVGQGDPGPFLGPGVTYQGPVGVEGRRELLRHARALFSPTRYLEPFGGVAVEAMMSGCPVISTDWGAYCETVQHGHTGYRCHTNEEFVWAARHVDSIDPGACRRWAVANYGLDRVARMYDNYFKAIKNLDVPEGWTIPDVGRTGLDYLGQDCSMFGAAGEDDSRDPGSAMDGEAQDPSPVAPGEPGVP